MTTLERALAPNSDQLNADDLITGPMTVTVKVVRVKEVTGKGQQPIEIDLHEYPRPYRPCKSMGRVLSLVWGGDPDKWTGRRMTLYRDESVQFGNERVGGIRISHVTDLGAKQRDIALTATRGKKALFTVRDLVGGVTAEELKEVLGKLREHLQTTEAIEAQAADLGVCGKVNSVSSWTREQIEAARAFIKSQQGPQQ